MAYVAPPKDTVVVVGGLGTQAGNNALNGGGATKASWDANSPSDFMGVNGAALASAASVAYDHAGHGDGEHRLYKNGSNIGLNVKDGTFINITTGTNIDVGIYEATRIDDDTLLVPDIQATGDNADTGIVVGGALDTLQTALDNTCNDAASSAYNRFIYDNITTETVTGTVKADVNAGTASTKIYVIGYNATLTAEDDIELTTTTDLTGEGAAVDRALFAMVTVDYYEFRNISFNAGGKDASRAMYGLYSADAADGTHSTFYNCNFYGAEAAGAYSRAGPRSYIDCEFYLNGTYGLNGVGSIYNSLIFSCTFHDNDLSGLYWRPYESSVFKSYFYDNGKDGAGHGVEHSGGSGTVSYVGNMIYGNATDGFQCNGSDYNLVFANNGFIGNGAYGADFSTMAIGDIGFFGFNLSGANTTADYYFGGGAGTDFTNFANGSNVDSAQSADALLKTITDGSEALYPETGSDLIDAGLGRTA